MKYKYIKCQLEALEGKFLWHWLIKKNHEIQDTLVILFPSKGTKYNQYALQYLEELLKKRQRKNAVLLTFDQDIVSEAKLYSHVIARVIYFSRRKALKLMKYATLYEFDDRLIIASLDEPYGRFGSRLLGLNGLTEEELFVIGVYSLFN